MRTAIIPLEEQGGGVAIDCHIPKPLLPVNMKAAFHYIVNECVDSGVERIGLVNKVQGAGYHRLLHGEQISGI